MTAADPLAGIGCAAPGCRRMPTRGRLCSWDADKLGQTLADIAADLTARAEPSLVGWRTGGGGGVLASEKTLLNLRQLDAQAHAPAVLGPWAAWLREQRNLHQATVTRTRQHLGRLASYKLPAPANPAADRDLLALHLDWIIAQPEVDQFWCQLRALWSQLRGHRPVRRCTCGGPVWVDQGGGWCSWCATPWAGRELLELPRPEEVA